MAERRPLVLVSGRQKELPAGDTLPGAGGTVKSVGLSVPTGLAVSDSPVTTSGTIVLSYAAGYRGYTNAENTKLAGIAAGATVGATWGTNLYSVPANISSWASSGIGPGDVVTLASDQAISGSKTFSGDNKFTSASGVLVGTGDWRIRADTADMYFRKGTQNRIAITSDGFLRNLSSGFVSSSVIVPSSDSYSSVGTSSTRWNTFYAVTGAINTSDAREKTPVRQMTERELAAAIDLGNEIGVYQWLSMIAEKGESGARLHIGMTVQRAIEIMLSHDVDPMRYGFVCYDSWPEIPEFCAVWETIPEVVDDFGNVVQERIEAGSEVIQQRRAAGDRYSFRQDELLAFIARGFAHRLAAMEQRLSTLEAGWP